jgi:hypothetical protein
MAGAMRLFQHDEFPNIVAAAAAARSLDEAFVEKDYYITEILRVVFERYQPGQMIFKGGTSLSKAWGLIERLSEDVDLLLVPERFEPRLGRGRVDTELATLTEAIATHPGLELDGGRSERVAGRARSDWFAFVPRFARIGIAPSIMTEPGTRGGTSPTTEREISSVVGRFLQEAGQGVIAEDLDSFPDDRSAFPTDLRREALRGAQSRRAARIGAQAFRPRRAALHRSLCARGGG